MNDLDNFGRRHAGAAEPGEHNPQRVSLVRLEHITLRYPVGDTQVTVLEDVNLTVRAGERVAIVGPSGSGKTSLLLLLSALEHPSDGQVHLEGRRLSAMDRDQLADFRRDHLGIVFQSFHLIPSLCALDNVALPLEIAGVRDADTRAAAMLDRVGLGARGQHFPSQLSGGEQQRVAIARALVHAPKLVLADEPTGNLDDHTGEQVAELLFELTGASGATLLLVTHDQELAARCDRILRLHDGRLADPLEAPRPLRDATGT